MIVVNDRNLKRLLREFPKQIKFASAKALTRLAQRGQVAMEVSVKSNYDNTKDWFKKNRPTGFKITPARKNKLRAQVYTGPAMTWAARQEFGESRKPRGGALIIPLYNKSGKRLGKNDAKWRGIKAPTWSKARGKKAAFDKYSSKGENRRTPSGKSKDYPFVFTSKKGVTFIIDYEGAKPTPLFMTKSSAKRTSRVLGMRKTVIKIVKDHARAEFQIAFEHAIRTAR